MAKRTIKYLLDPEVKRLNEILKKFYAKNKRDCLLISLALHTGARAHEILDISVGDICFSGSYVLIKASKNGHPRDIPLPRGLNSKLKSYCKDMKVVDLVFPIGYSRLRAIWHMYRPVERNFHSIRHTAALRLYKKTFNMQIVKYMLGHKTLSSTQIYVDYVYSQTELRKALGV